MQHNFRGRETLSALVQQLDTHSSAPSSPPELGLIADELSSLHKALDSKTPQQPSNNLLPSWSLIWQLLAKNSENELAKVLRDVISAVVFAVGGVVVKARGARTPAASSWQSLMTSLWESANDLGSLYKSAQLEGVCSELKRDTIVIAMLNQFTCTVTPLEHQLSIGKNVLRDIVRLNAQQKRRGKLSSPRPTRLAAVLDSAQHVNLARIALDLASELRSRREGQQWGEELFRREVYGDDAPLLQAQFAKLDKRADPEGDSGYDSDSADDGGSSEEETDFYHGGRDRARDRILKLALRGDPGRAQSLDASVIHAYPADSIARAVSFSCFDVCPGCGGRDHGGRRVYPRWSINRDSIEAAVACDEDELLANDDDYNLIVKLKIVTNCAPTLDGKPLKPAKLGPAKGSAWEVEGDEDDSGFNDQAWVIIFVCRINKGLIDLGPVFDDRTERYPNLIRTPSTHTAHSGASTTFLDYIKKLVPVQIKLESSEGELDSDNDSSAESSPKKRKSHRYKSKPWKRRRSSKSKKGH